MPPSASGQAIRSFVERGDSLAAALRVGYLASAPHQRAWCAELDFISDALERVVASGATFAPGPMLHPGGGDHAPDLDYHRVNRPRPIVHGPRNFE